MKPSSPLTADGLGLSTGQILQIKVAGWAAGDCTVSGAAGRRQAGRSAMAKAVKQEKAKSAKVRPRAGTGAAVPV